MRTVWYTENPSLTSILPLLGFLKMNIPGTDSFFFFMCTTSHNPWGSLFPMVVLLGSMKEMGGCFSNTWQYVGSAKGFSVGVSSDRYSLAYFKHLHALFRWKVLHDVFPWFSCFCIIGNCVYPWLAESFATFTVHESHPPCVLCARVVFRACLDAYTKFPQVRVRIC